VETLLKFDYVKIRIEEKEDVRKIHEAETKTSRVYLKIGVVK